MNERIAALLQNETVRTELRRAWEESSPGVFGGHEEGGFICINAQREYVIDRWQRGSTSEIFAPPHPGGKRNNEIIVATFHTHPNTGNSFEQEPNIIDCEIVAEDGNLKTIHDVGKFILSRYQLYFVLPDGEYMTLGEREVLLSA